MELEAWRILKLQSMDTSPPPAVAGCWAVHWNHEARHRDWMPGRSSRRDLRLRASYGGGKDLLPSSIQVLKRKKRQRNSAGSVSKAFSSMVYMLRSMHRFALEMLRVDEDLWSFVQKEMHSSLLWLFQQVFSSTPVFMVSLMVLLANFAVHSMDCSIAVQTSSFLAPVITIGRVAAPVSLPEALDHSPDTIVSKEVIQSCGSKGGGGKLGALVAAGSAGDDSASSLRSWTTVVRDESGDGRNHLLAVTKFLQQVPAPAGVCAGDLHSLAAPVELEPDNYECFDRTDLLYQQALRADEEKNPVILANYAQFLYVVRHDHDRAEKLFRLAMEADPSDGESLSRFASFLWLARGDKQGAEDAFKDAIATDPGNPFHCGSYAHFLWHT